MTNDDKWWRGGGGGESKRWQGYIILAFNVCVFSHLTSPWNVLGFAKEIIVTLLVTLFVTLSMDIYSLDPVEQWKYHVMPSSQISSLKVHGDFSNSFRFKIFSTPPLFCTDLRLSCFLFKVFLSMSLSCLTSFIMCAILNAFWPWSRSRYSIKCANSFSLLSIFFMCFSWLGFSLPWASLFPLCPHFRLFQLSSRPPHQFPLLPSSPAGTGDRRARPKCNRKRNPSYFRRQRQRREATNNHISEHLSWQESHEDSRMTANLPETNDADKEEQGSDDENDLLVRFSSLGRSLKTFQRDLTTADQRVESAKKVSSPLRKRRKKRR